MPTDPKIMEMARQALEWKDRGVPGPWTLHSADGALTPTHWPADCPHVSDVAIAFRNREMDDENYAAQTDSLVWCAMARTREPILARALLAAEAENARLRAACSHPLSLDTNPAYCGICGAALQEGAPQP